MIDFLIEKFADAPWRTPAPPASRGRRGRACGPRRATE
jgi:hypothetical protein